MSTTHTPTLPELARQIVGNIATAIQSHELDELNNPHGRDAFETAVLNVEQGIAAAHASLTQRVAELEQQVAAQKDCRNCNQTVRGGRYVGHVHDNFCAFQAERIATLERLRQFVFDYADATHDRDLAHALREFEAEAALRKEPSRG